MKVLINGGCGFLGSNLAAHALNRGENVFVLDNLSRFGSADNLAWLRSLGLKNFIPADTRNSNDVATVVQEICPDAIFHLAGQVAMTTSIANPRKDFEVNALGAFNVIDAVRRFSPRTKIIFSSTNKVYGDLEYIRYEETPTRYVCPDLPNGFAEDTRLDFSSPYGCSKGCADQYFLDAHRVFGLNTAVFRHSSMYGGRQFATYDQGWVGWFCQKAMEIKKNIAKGRFTISGNGKQVRDLLHAEDMISLYFSALDNFEKVNGNAFNIGAGMENSLSLLELFAFLEKQLGIRMDFEQLPPRQSDQKVFVADTTKIRAAIGWTPKVSYTEGVSKMIKWVEGLV